MDAEEKKPKGILKSKPLRITFAILGFSILALYLLDTYIIPDRVSVYLTREPRLDDVRKRVVVSQDEKGKESEEGETKEQIRKEEKADSYKGEAVIPVKPRIKNIAEVTGILGFKYPDWAMNDWNYNIERGKGKKIVKNIYGADEINDWNVDMLGEENASLLKGGIAAFLKKEEEARKTALEEQSAGEKEQQEKDQVENADRTEMAPDAQAESGVPKKDAKKEDKGKKAVPPRERIDTFSYKLIRFMPGLADDGFFLDYEGQGVGTVVSGHPDFHESQVARPEEYRDRFLALGNGGSVVYEVVGGDLVDGEGPDFVVYGDAAFTKGIKTAKVEVAERDAPGAYIELPCDSVNPPYKGCAGVHAVLPSQNQDPISAGGDPIDLARIGVKRVHFIRITDTGDNKNQPGIADADGFDLDSIALIHAYKK